jgi:hypothetical protein
MISYTSFGLPEEDVDPLHTWHLYSEPLQITVKSENVVATPLKQFQSGISVDKIQCDQSLILIIKSSDGSLACVKPETKRILIERGWAKPV